MVLQLGTSDYVNIAGIITGIVVPNVLVAITGIMRSMGKTRDEIAMSNVAIAVLAEKVTQGASQAQLAVLAEKVASSASQAQVAVVDSKVEIIMYSMGLKKRD